MLLINRLFEYVQLCRLFRFVHRPKSALEIAIVAGADETLHPYACSWDGVLCGTDSGGVCEGKEIMISIAKMFETLGLSEASIEAMDWIEVTRILGESPCIQEVDLLSVAWAGVLYLINGLPDLVFSYDGTTTLTGSKWYDCLVNYWNFDICC